MTRRLSIAALAARSASPTFSLRKLLGGCPMSPFRFLRPRPALAATALILVAAVSLTTFLSPPAAAQEPEPIDTPTQGICDRTAKVQALLIKELARDGHTRTCEEVTAEDLASITGIYDYSTYLTTLQPGDLDGLTQLGRLWLPRGGEITELPAGLFAETPNLKILTLPHQKIGELPAGIFDDVPKLGALNLYASELTSLPEEVFEHTPNLRILELADNKLAAVSKDTLDDVPELEILNLHHNRLTELPDNLFDNHTKLRDLDLSANRITALHEDTFDGLSQLTNLNLSGNKLPTLPEDVFEGLSNLTILELQDNPFTSVPVDVFEGLTSLTSLWTNLPNVSPDYFEHVPQLTKLFVIAGSQSIPEDSFHKLTDLERLTLGYGDITSLPADAFDGLSKLKWLDLAGNKLTSLDEDIFDGLTSLESLRLLGNELTSLDEDIFEGLTSLETLSLGSNQESTQLSTLPANLFADLAKLKTLIISDAGLDTLPEGAFNGLEAVERIDLTLNNLRSLPAGLFEGITKLNNLGLRQTQISTPVDPPAWAVELGLDPDMFRIRTGDETLVFHVHPELVQGNRIVAKVIEGAPFDISVMLSAEGGTLSANQVTIPAGSTKSPPVTVTPLSADRGMVTVKATYAIFEGWATFDHPAGACDCWGFRTGPGDPITVDATFATITGEPRVGETLTADTSYIQDPDGMENAVFSYQWIADDAAIGDATDSTYDVSVEDVGKGMKVKVSFTDDADNQETLASGATATVAPRSDNTVKDEEAPVWSADMLVVEYTSVSIGADSADLFSNVGGSAGLQVKSLWSYTPDRDLRLEFTEGVAGAADLTLQVGDLTLEFPAGSSGQSSFRWKDVDVDWEDGQTLAVRIVPTTATVAPQPNSPATGAPTISGTAQVGETLTADTSGIADADGLDNASFTYQWMADDANIQGATNSRYTLSDDDVGKTLKVRVSFTDNANNEETLTSAPTAAVEARLNTPATGLPAINGTVQAGETLTVDTSGIADNDGLDNVSYSYQWLADDANIPGETTSTYALVTNDVGKAIKVKVSFTDDAGNEETLTSAAMGTVEAAPPMIPGAPTIDSLTLDTRDPAEIGPPSYALLTVAWSAPADNGGSVITSYDLRVFPRHIPSNLPDKPAAEWHVWEDIWDSGDLEVTLTELVKGVNYEIQVRAVNTSGYGPWSTGARKTFASAPGRIEVLPFSDDGAITVTQGKKVDDGGSSLTAYDVRYIRRDAPDKADANWTLLRNLEPNPIWNTLEYTVSGLTNGVWYDLQGRAVNAVGPGPWSETFEQRPAGNPSAPVLDQVTGGDRTLTPGWRRPTSDGGVGIVDYTWCYIRSDAPNKLGRYWTCGSYAGYGFGPVIDDAYLTYTITGLTNNVQYDVRLFAHGYYGDRSPASNMLSGTPLETPGAPTVSGTAQVGETLTADITGIADAYGLDDATFAYQWLADDANIQGATNSTYTLADSDAGKTIKVRVSFTDDVGNQETLTSAATAAVAARPNTPATGSLTISGIARVGETLTVDVSGISDADGLETVLDLSPGNEYTYYGMNFFVDYDYEADAGILRGTSFVFTYWISPRDAGKVITATWNFKDDRGAWEHFRSEPTATVAATVPDAPQNLKVSIGDPGALDLTWEAPTWDGIGFFPGGTHGDGGSPVTGYKVQWKEAADGWDTPGDVSGETVTGTSHTLTGLTGGVEYTIRVIAGNSVGDGPASVEVAAEAPGQETGIWSADLTVGVKDEHTGYSDFTGFGSLSRTGFSVDGANYTVRLIVRSGDKLYLGLSQEMSAGVVLRVGAVEFVSGDASPVEGGAAYLLRWDRPGLSWSEGDKVGVGLTLVEESHRTGPDENNPATGLPVIRGTARVGETLTADVAAIADEDGLTGATFSYQWVANDGTTDTNIPEATALTYTASDEDVGKTIQVRVSFADDAGNEEALTSAATEAVKAPAQADSEDEPSLQSYITVVVTDDESDPDNVGTSFTITWNDADACSENYNAYISNGMDVYRGGDKTHLGSTASAGAEITASLSNLQGEGLRFYLELYCGTEDSVRWVSRVIIPHDEEDPSTSADTKRRLVPGIYSSEPPLTALSVSPGTLTPAFHSHTFQYAVPDVGNANGRITVTATGKTGYTVELIRDDHSAFRFPIRGCDPWRSNPCSWNYQDDPDNAVYPLTDADADTPGFQVDLDEGENDITVHVYNHYDSGFSYRLTVTRAANNSLATGRPSITGTAQVGQTLTADTSGIADGDGLSGVTYNYQWLSSRDTEIQGATDATYILQASDEGKVIKVKVSFTDDAGNEEELTSEATGAVLAQPNSPATGAPAIIGTAQVGETLTADPSGIADPDGLTDVAFTYQWIRNDGIADTDISGATGETYTPVSGDQGKSIKVRVSFTDDAGNRESLTSLATQAVVSVDVEPSEEGICDRTEKVQEAILAKLSEVTDCADVTATHLGSITGTLSLRESGMSSLQEGDFDQLDSLRELYLGHNSLAELPDGIFDSLTSLQRLYLGNNELSELPDQVFDSLTNLTELGLGNNSLIELPNGVFDGLSDLEELYLGENSLSELPDGIFDNLTSLQRLYLGNNELSELPDQVFDSLTNLTELGLGNNSLSKLSDGALTKLADLEELYLPENSLNQLPPGVFEGLSNLQQLHLQDNPGVPFALAADLVKVATDTMVVQVVQGAPFKMNIALSATDATLSDTSITIPAGATRSVSVVVTASGPDPVTVSVVTAAFDGGTYQGIQTRAGESLTLGGSAATNSPATGAPAITGTVQVGETLTADTSDVSDADGLSNVSYSYQWLSSRDTEIQGATNSTYTLVADDIGKTVKVRVSFADDAGNEETLTSAATEAVTSVVNNPATGLPVISGTARVGETLTADTSGIADADGLTNVSYSYQWIRSDGSDDTDIAGETASTYTLVTADAGKTIKVRVSFTDDANNQETLTSAATDAVAAAATVPGEPEHLNVSSHDEEALDLYWEPPASDGGSPVTGYKVQWKEAAGSWDTPEDVAEETVTGTTHTITGLTEGVEYAVRVMASNEVGEGPASAEQTGIPRETGAPEMVMLRVDGATLRVSYDENLDQGATPPADAFVVKVACRCDDTKWQDEKARRAVDAVSVKGDTVALTLASAVTAEDYVVISYTPPSDEASPRVQDAAGNPAAAIRPTQVFNDTEEVSEEEAPAQNSPATGAPTISGTAQVGETLMAETSGIADEDGLTNVWYSYQWIADDADIEGATNSTYTLAADDEGKAIKVKVSFTDDGGNEETLTSAATTAVEPAPNNPATGQPTISGTAQVGETLTVETSAIADEDGLDDAAFSYQWAAGGTDIDGATGSSYTLAGDEEGLTIQVWVSFNDDKGNPEAVTSAATEVVAPMPVPLTVSLENAPTTHDGESSFTFELRFSEEFKLGFKTLRDHAFTVSGGVVEKAQRLEKPSNIHWRITVQPDSNGDVTITLPITGDCGEPGAICTEDGRPLSNRLELTVSGPGS